MNIYVLCTLLNQVYPKEHEKALVLRDGTEVFLRPMKPTDTDMLWDMFASMSLASLGFLRKRITRERIEKWTANIDYDKHLSIVAVVEETGMTKIIAQATLTFRDSAKSDDEAGFGIWILDKYQNKGLGTTLTKIMLETAREKKVRKVSLGVRADNKRAVRVYEKCGFSVEERLRESYADGKYYDNYTMSVYL